MSDQPTSEIRTVKASDDLPASPRDKRSKIALIVLVAGFGLLMVIQGPTLLSAISGGDSESPAAEGVAPADAAAEGEAEGVDAASVAEASSAATSPTALRDSDLPERAQVHELSKIDTFANDDPFKPLVTPPAVTTTDTGGSSAGTTTPATDAPTGDSEGSSTGSSTTATTSPAAGETTQSTEGGTTTTTATPAVEYSGARLSINDVSQISSIGDKFPTANPVFVINSVEANMVEIGLVEGAFSTGTQSLAVELGETRTLVSQPDGVRYAVRFDEPIRK